MERNLEAWTTKLCRRVARMTVIGSVRGIPKAWVYCSLADSGSLLYGHQAPALLSVGRERAIASGIRVQPPLPLFGFSAQKFIERLAGGSRSASFLWCLPRWT